MISQKTSAFQKAVLARIPFEACPDCEQAGYDLAETFKKLEKTVLLQNQLRDQVHLWRDGREVNPFGG
ncbi:hypothetical protein UNSWDHB_701 [Dehalobacter sp. UNSWDHB]|nr:hypothetical protein UNSWDHB_701 [Dehalobacter sp. UNSWDHB]